MEYISRHSRIALGGPKRNSSAFQCSGHRVQCFAQGSCVEVIVAATSGDMLAQTSVVPSVTVSGCPHDLRKGLTQDSKPEPEHPKTLNPKTGNSQP